MNIEIPVARYVRGHLHMRQAGGAGCVTAMATRLPGLTSGLRPRLTSTPAYVLDKKRPTAPRRSIWSRALGRLSIASPQYALNPPISAQTINAIANEVLPLFHDHIGGLKLMFHRMNGAPGACIARYLKP